MELAALIPHRSDSPLPSPSTTSSKGNKRQIFTFVGVAATVGILVNVLWGGINTTEAVSRTPVVKHWIYQSHESETAVIYAPGVGSNSKVNSMGDKDEEWTLERIKEVAELSKGLR
ncbi:hypothetical protein FRC02_003624 [Tulasnella sp. 418]|nr:hypothetical protein FRC02_003624 [Tulasnella sp. 418]